MRARRPVVPYEVPARRSEQGRRRRSARDEERLWVVIFIQYPIPACMVVRVLPAVSWDRIPSMPGWDRPKPPQGRP